MSRLALLAALAIVVALPFLLRPERTAGAAADDILVVITPHNEAIRHEFGRGFAAWHRERTGRTVAIDWRIVGGTSEIARFLEGEYAAAFEQHWTRRLGRPWSLEVQAGFANPRLPADAPEPVRAARAAFLASAVGCGIDVFFGGGTYDFERQAQAGRLVDAGLAARRPGWFTEETIPAAFAGETYRDPQGRWIGTVLSSYGIVFNRDALRRLGFPGTPARWEDLADPRLAGEVALADPTKSGSVAKAFENIIQQQMQRRLAVERTARPGAPAAELEAAAVRDGWAEGLRLLQRIGANARYFTDSSQKPPIDVAAGNCAAGLCIDFYGRQQEEAVRRRDRSDRVGYVSPPGGSTASVDPIGLLRGAPHAEVGRAFIEYTLSPEGQRLWNYRPGTPGGPERFALRRLPVRREFYADAAGRAHRSDPDEAPYAVAEPLVYREAWTGRIFREMSLVIRVMCQDTHLELRRAWRAIHAASPERRARALAILQDISRVAYDRVLADVRPRLASRNKVEEVRLAAELAAFFRENYRRAEAAARGETAL